MKRKRFSVEQIVAILKRAEMGMPVAELIRQVGISEQTFHRWKKAVHRLRDRPSSSAQATAGREWQAEEVRGRTDAGPSDVAGCAEKKLVQPSRRRAVVT